MAEGVNHAIPPADRALDRMQKDAAEGSYNPRSRKTPSVYKPKSEITDPNSPRSKLPSYIIKAPVKIKNEPIDFSKKQNPPPTEPEKPADEPKDTSIKPAESAEAQEAKPLWTAITASQRGKEHEKKNIENQDYVDSIIPQKDGDPAILAVANGHGAKKCTRSDIGAKFAVESTLSALQKTTTEQFSSDEEMKEFIRTNLTSEWKQKVADHLKNKEMTEDEVKIYEADNALDFLKSRPEFPYSSSVVGVLVQGDLTIYVQIGEANISTINKDGDSESQIIPLNQAKTGEDEKDQASLSRKEAEKFIQIKIVRGESPRIITLSTPGLYNSFPQDKGVGLLSKEFIDALDENAIPIQSEREFMARTFVHKAVDVNDKSEDATIGFLIPPKSAPNAQAQAEPNQAPAESQTSFIDSKMEKSAQEAYAAMTRGIFKAHGLPEPIDTVKDIIEDSEAKTLKKITELYLKDSGLFDYNAISEFIETQIKGLTPDVKLELFKIAVINIDKLKQDVGITARFKEFGNIYQRVLPPKPCIKQKSVLFQNLDLKNKVPEPKINDYYRALEIDILNDLYRLDAEIRQFEMQKGVADIVDPYGILPRKFREFPSQMAA